jgi:hypothetical protein
VKRDLNSSIDFDYASAGTFGSPVQEGESQRFSNLKYKTGKAPVSNRDSLASTALSKIQKPVGLGGQGATMSPMGAGMNQT